MRDVQDDGVLNALVNENRFGHKRDTRFFGFTGS